jgi:hypothetical protein
VAALIYAAVYAGFLDAIEPAEHPYHRDDVPAYLRQAVTVWGGEAEHQPHTTGPR